MMATRFPIDYDALNKGDVIPAARIEQILGVTPDSKRYPLLLLRLKGRIERELVERGRVWTVIVEKGDLKILTDPEASTYNFSESGIARRKERKCFLRQSHVDVTSLPEDQRQCHERRLLVQGRYMQAAEQVSKQLKLEAHRRDVPGLPQA